MLIFIFCDCSGDEVGAGVGEKVEVVVEDVVVALVIVGGIVEVVVLVVTIKVGKGVNWICVSKGAVV